MEDSVHLLRRASLESWVCWWAGSIPFALGALRFSNDVLDPRMPDTACAAEAFALALLLVWMNCWRAAFAGRLRAQLAGEPNSPWTLGSLANLVGMQAFLGALRLVAVPLAALIVFPLPQAVAFFRIASVLNARDALTPRDLFSKARRLAALDPRQTWSVLTFLSLLYLLVLINLGIVVGLLPQLVRILSGYESAFSRSGRHFVESPLFFLLVLAVSWIVFDPMVQAVYCVRCFRGESLETGEDLRLALRRLMCPQP
jgi:hypothetical protein